MLKLFLFDFDMIENLNFEKTIFGDSVIFNADAYDILPSLDDGSIDICLTDMPYAAESFGGKCTACE